MSHFKQKQGYGCGLYALANLFREESMITDERLKQSKDGNNIGQLNNWLKEDGYNLFIDAFYFNLLGEKIPDDVCELRPKGEGVVSFPILIDVQKTEQSKMHLIAADIMPDGRLLVIDSLEDECEITTLKELNHKWHRVFGIWNIRSYSEEGWFMRLK